LRTHPGVGLLTSLCLVHTLGDLARFSATRKVAAYVGFDPVETFVSGTESLRVDQ
jgi:transposase